MILSSSAPSSSMVSTQQPAFLPSRLQPDRALLLEQREGALPEVQAQDVALVGQQVVADAQPLAWSRGGSSTMRPPPAAPRRAVSLPPASISCSTPACSARRWRVGGVEVAHPRVEVPAVVVEAGLPRESLHLGVAPCPPGAGSPRSRPPPARPCRRCSSGRTTAWPRPRSARTNVSPRMALRRWPMCAALLGLMLVCSTMMRPGGAARRARVAQRAPPAPVPARRGAGTGSRSRHPPPRPCARSGSAASAGASFSAMARGLWRSALARSKGAVRARSPMASRGGYWNENAARSAPRTSRAAARTPPSRRA